MKIGVPKELKNNESRVGLTPSGVLELKKQGHQVYVQTDAGAGSNFPDEFYIEPGADILADIESVYEIADLIVKVKEPQPKEYALISKGQIIFTYFHFASSRPLTEAMIENGSVCIAYEMVQLSNGLLPLLIPMSEVAGRMAVQQGAKYLEKPKKGKGLLLGGVPGVQPGRVLVLGAGTVGIQAAKMAAGLGAQVTVTDIDIDKLRYVNDIMPPHVVTEFSSEYNIRKGVKRNDLIIGGVLLPGEEAPKLITEDMLATMEKGTVMVDVAVDQGGCFASTRPTTHDEPVYVIDDVVHYCVANMPGAVPQTSTIALTNVTLPYVRKIANSGWGKAVDEKLELKRGLSLAYGEIIDQQIHKILK
ncbi:MAG: alanine dehydrogenase [Psychroflexus sp.]|nr:alanine dehydrogenase [Psychroflexus sp.]MDR9448445.1 alanine dehydrogenase [Psychroflexus sp.]